MADRTVNFKVLADSASFDAAMAKAGASTKTLSKSMDKATAQAEELQKATNAARTAALEQAAAERAAATASEKSATAAKKAARAKAEQVEANRLAADAAQKLENNEIGAAEAQKLSAKAARSDRDAQIATAAAERAAAIEAEKLEKASIKAAAAQLAQAKAARAAGEAAGSRGLSKKQGRSLLSSLIGDGSIVGEQAGKAFMQGFSSAAEEAGSGITKILAAAGVSASELLGPAVVGAIVGAAPFIIAAMGGALIAGVGAAGIGAAVAGQIKSPAVKGAWTNLGHYAQQTLADVTSPLEDDLVRAAGQFAFELDFRTKDLRAFFKQLGPEISLLASGITEFLDPILAELPDFASNLQPVFSELSVDMGKFGNTVADFLRIISTNSAGAADALRVVFAILSGGLRVIGYTIAGAEVIVHGFFRNLEALANGLSKIPGPWQETWKSVAHAFSETANQSATAASGVKNLTGTVDKSSAAAQKAKQDFADLISQLSGLAGAAGDAAQAQVSADQSIDALTKSLKENGDAFSGNSAKAHENEAALGAATKAAADAADAKYKETGSIDAANAEYERYIGKLRSTLQQAGLTNAQIDTLIGTYETVPQYIQTLIKDPGAVSSTTNVKDLRAAQKTLERLIKVAVQTHAPTSEVDKLKKRLAELHNREIWITIHQQVVGHTANGNALYRTDSGGRAVLPRADGGIVETYANGGVRDPEHVAQIVPPGTYRLFGEDETGGEAYIPLSPAKRARSMSIVTDVARRFGMAVSRPQSSVPAAGSVAAAPAVHRTVNIYPQRTDFTLADLNQAEYRQDIIDRVGRR